MILDNSPCLPLPTINASYYSREGIESLWFNQTHNTEASFVAVLVNPPCTCTKTQSHTSPNLWGQKSVLVPILTFLQVWPTHTPPPLVSDRQEVWTNLRTLPKFCNWPGVPACYQLIGQFLPPSGIDTVYTGALPRPNTPPLSHSLPFPHFFQFFLIFFSKLIKKVYSFLLFWSVREIGSKDLFSLDTINRV